MNSPLGKALIEAVAACSPGDVGTARGRRDAGSVVVPTATAGVNRRR